VNDNAAYDKALNSEKKRLRAILAYEFSGSRSWESCDIVTREEVPQDVIAYLVALPDTDQNPAWV
jgi:hypothetical protein